MSNPYLNDKAIATAAQAGWAAPDPSTAVRSTPITDGPISSWRPRVSTHRRIRSGRCTVI